MITKEQVSRAREMLRWSIVDLSRWSRVHRLAILAFETGDDLDEWMLARMKEALENYETYLSSRGIFAEP